MIKKGNLYKKNVDPSTRAQLIRKGNEFFSLGNIPAAQKIFVVVDYKDGLARLGDYYYENNDVYNAAKMYFMSGNESKIRMFAQSCARVITSMLDEDVVKSKESNDKTYDKIIVSGDKNG